MERFRIRSLQTLKILLVAVVVVTVALLFYRQIFINRLTNLTASKYHVAAVVRHETSSSRAQVLKNEPSGVPVNIPGVISRNYSRGIPHIIHQMYKSTLVPESYHGLMQSWMKFNPTYKYYFWTDNDIRNLIKDHYPAYLKMYDSYKYALQRADVGRYFILYHYGGIYADADMECVKSFDDYIAIHNCTVVPEPIEQTRLMWELDILYTNCIMICQPGHEFIWKVIEGLPNAIKTIPQAKTSAPVWIVKTTGPIYMKTVLDSYVISNRSNIHLAPYEELVPITDVTASGFFKDKCEKKKLINVARYKKSCLKLKKWNYFISDTSRAYSVHHWHHLGYEHFHGKAKKMKQREVSELFQNTVVSRYGKNG